MFAVTAISASVVLLFACSSSDSAGIPATADSGGAETGTEAGGPASDSGGTPDAGGQDTGATSDAADSGDAASDGGVTLTVQPGTVVNVSGDKGSVTFVWGYWVGTAGDTTAAHDTRTARAAARTRADGRATMRACPQLPSRSPPRRRSSRFLLAQARSKFATASSCARPIRAPSTAMPRPGWQRLSDPRFIGVPEVRMARAAGGS